ncbi:GNAT family N-acetyltransferase [Streptomyces sp. NPDC101152]|uniref:GNAT family N-acetyltransferase n=1 Tax=Streptomyces sp. NPDC101152 TaxID=3366116 RepID=UPI003819B454
MSLPVVRPFRRDDRDQLTDLVNAHVAVVVPGLSVSVNTVLSHLERQPGEFITDPWVAERVTLVAERSHSVVAAAHLLRYRADAEVGEACRDSGEIDWFVCRPPASFWPDAEQAGDRPMAACLAQFARAEGLADVGNLHVEAAAHGQGLENRLLAEAADRLRPAGTDRLLAYEQADDTAAVDLLRAAGFRS